MYKIRMYGKTKKMEISATENNGIDKALWEGGDIVIA
jgi:hypothetical protein